MYLSSKGSFGLRRSCTEVRQPTFWWFCVNPGIPPQMPQKGAGYIHLVNFHRLKSIQKVVPFRGFSSRVSRGRCQAQERRTPAAVPTAVGVQRRETWLGPPYHNRKYIATNRDQLVAEIYLQCLPCATQMHTTQRQWSLLAPSWPGSHGSQEVFEEL